MTPQKTRILEMVANSTVDAEGTSYTPTYRQIARELGISPSTVKAHFYNPDGIFARLKAGDQTAAILQAIRLGLIQVAGIIPAPIEPDGSNPSEFGPSDNVLL
ncbi:MAG TPA: LuxR C-terminal-related transcriptional regulator [Candidatus Bathyarchaeia archaeon]|nr:LuxR C-terminal-related transcriptional regulator [Candidatus Bathyarchaeia archaeon]